MSDDLAALTEWAAGLDVATAPVEVGRRATDLLIDTVAVAALGSGRPELIALTRSVGATTPEGPATAVGSERGWPVGTAALLTGSAVAADQLQDGHRLARGHPASHVAPAVLALAEALDHDLDEARTALLAGYEVGVRVGRAMGGTPAGVHDIGTWGQVAVSAGVARLLAPGDAAAIRRAVELSAAAVLLTDARTVFAGCTGSHLFLGLSIQHGLAVAQAAVAGLAAEPGTVDRHLFGVAGAAPGRLDRGGDWEILGGYLKRHPSCAHLHGVNDAVADLVTRGMTAERIRSVQVDVFAGAAGFGAVADTELAARFSIPTTVAVALVTGRLDETTMTDEVVGSAPVRELAARVATRHDPALDAGYPDGRPARVRVELTDGSTQVAEVGRTAWDADRCPEPGEVDAKARRLLRGRFGPAGEEIVALLRAGERPRVIGGRLRELAGTPQR